MNNGTPPRIRARAPLRLGLAGGGSDVAPYSDLFGGQVLNATIDKYAYATVEPCVDAGLTFVAAEKNVRWRGELAWPVEAPAELRLHAAVYNRIVRQFCNSKPFPVVLTTASEAPQGSGLGASSTLVVAMVRAFCELLSLPLGEYELAHLAYEIERVDAKLAGGKQDQYAAAFGGVNFMEFYAEDRVIVNPLRIKPWVLSELEASLVLFFTGVSRESARIIEEQTRHVQARDDAVLEATHAVKREAVVMKEALLKGDFHLLEQSLREGWERKKDMARGISNPAIEKAYEVATATGARAGKVSGAGGGGFMMFLADPVRRHDVERALEAQGGTIMSCKFTKHGAEGWRVQ